MSFLTPCESTRQPHSTPDPFISTLPTRSQCRDIVGKQFLPSVRRRAGGDDGTSRCRRRLVCACSDMVHDCPC